MVCTTDLSQRLGSDHVSNKYLILADTTYGCDKIINIAHRVFGTIFSPEAVQIVKHCTQMHFRFACGSNHTSNYIRELISWIVIRVSDWSIIDHWWFWSDKFGSRIVVVQQAHGTDKSRQRKLVTPNTYWLLWHFVSWENVWKLKTKLWPLSARESASERNTALWERTGQWSYNRNSPELEKTQEDSQDTPHPVQIENKTTLFELLWLLFSVWAT